MEAITDQLTQLKLVEPISTKKSRKDLTSYWGIEIDPRIFEHPQIQSHLNVTSELIKLERIHSTLLYVGKKDDNPYEIEYLPLEGKECTLTTNTFGSSTEAMALLVDQITYLNDQNEKLPVPTHVTPQHVTLALKKGVKPVDSVKCLTENLLERLEPESVVIHGKIKRFLY